MSNKSDDNRSVTQVDTGGGTFVDGNINAGKNFVGGDYIDNRTINIYPPLDQNNRDVEQVEKQLRKQKVETAARDGEINDVDYINIQRIAELALGTLNNSLADIVSYNNMQRDLANQPLLGLGIEAVYVTDHFVGIFKKLRPRITLENLDDLLSKKALRRNDFIGTFCFYVGGLYGKGLSWPITSESEIARLWMRRRGYYCEWLIDPRFITSNTALERFMGHSVYIVYGRIKSVGEKVLGNKNHIKIDIRPFLVGTPTETMDRKPAIANIRELQNYPDNEELAISDNGENDEEWYC